MLDQKFPLEKTYQQWVHLRDTNPTYMAQELAKLRPSSMEEYKFLNLLLQGRGLKELLLELQSEQELR